MSDGPSRQSSPRPPARPRRARPQSPEASALAPHPSRAWQTGEPRWPNILSAPQSLGPWQTPSVCHLESCASRFGNLEGLILGESPNRRVAITDLSPKFYWNSVSPHIQGAIRYLNVTSDGREWIANLYSNVFRAER